MCMHTHLPKGAIASAKDTLACIASSGQLQLREWGRAGDCHVLAGRGIIRQGRVHRWVSGRICIPGCGNRECWDIGLAHRRLHRGLQAVMIEEKKLCPFREVTPPSESLVLHQLKPKCDGFYSVGCCDSAMNGCKGHIRTNIRYATGALSVSRVIIIATRVIVFATRTAKIEG